MHSISGSFSVSYNFPVHFVEDSFNKHQDVFSDVLQLDQHHKPLILPVIESEIIQHFPQLTSQINAMFESLALPIIPVFSLQGGEAGKNASGTIEQIIDQCIAHNIDRHSYILAIGGGAFIDMVGYAAAIAHRGVRLIRMPTTVLGQNDAGIGVKNAINYRQRKNFLGTFCPPHAVINDYQFIKQLPKRDKRAGIAEAIKVALIKDATFFNQLTTNVSLLNDFEQQAMQSMIAQCAELHLYHICNNGDPFERGSARPLDFGHWSAHALEELSNFSLRHGEAVAIGILIDARYSHYQQWIDREQLKIIEELIFTLGFQVCTTTLNKLDIDQSLDNFRIHLGGELCITMLNGIGQSHEVNQIDHQIMKRCVTDIVSSWNEK